MNAAAESVASKLSMYHPVIRTNGPATRITLAWRNGTKAAFITWYGTRGPEVTFPAYMDEPSYASMRYDLKLAIERVLRA